MATGISRSSGMRMVGIGAGLLALAGLAVTPVVAQQKKEPAKKATAAPKKEEQQSAWVKLCEKTQVQETKDGKAVAAQRSICLTHHERLDGNTGMVLVSAAIRTVDGSDKNALMIMVPLGMALPPGMKAAIYTKDQWAKAQKNEKIDDKALKPIDLKYTLCHQGGCTAEVDTPADFLKQMQTGGGLMVLAMNLAGQPIAFPVPLDGFDVAHKGAPVDNEKYGEARNALMKQIYDRRVEMLRQYEEQMKAQAAAGAGAAPAAGGGAPAAKAPAKK